MSAVIAERLAEVARRGLDSGAHADLADGMCVLTEAHVVQAEAA